MSTNPQGSPQPDVAPLSDKTSEVERESWDHALLRSMEPRAISPTPVSRGEAHAGDPSLERRARGSAPLLRTVMANPALGLGVGFIGGLLAGLLWLRRG
ncbi:MAG: hypothetical protein EOP85_17610 [Verrucomicrobiaceae bacterium]|nr:MAG: hypothetical protein EOP85_17610 [Verrucomicrobiaceae bacterium]